MKIKLGVMFGGNSVEHEISIISAVQAMAAANRDKYEVVPVYITKDNLMYTGPELTDIEQYRDLSGLIARLQRVILVRDAGQVVLVKYPQRKFGKNEINSIDVAFPIVHGTNVEDGALQGYIQTLGLPYVGCDVLSSAVGMDKYVMKTILSAAGVPVLDCLLIDKKSYALDTAGTVADIERRFGYPVIVKPVNLGSSVGISRAFDKNELENAVELAAEFSQRVLVERAVKDLREVNCSVLGDSDEALASVCEEPVNTGAILSYNDKYAADSKTKGMGGAKRKIPADIPDAMRDEIQRLAVKTFKTLRCGGVSRIDFLIEGEDVYVNEINTIPGSLSFYLWAESGVEYPELIDRLVKLALKRQRENESLTFSYKTNILEGASFTGGKTGKFHSALLQDACSRL